MKILTYKIPIDLVRNGEDIELIIHDEDKVLQNNLTEEVSSSEESNITTIAAKIGTQNANSKTAAKGTLLSKETEGTGFITWKMLSD